MRLAGPRPLAGGDQLDVSSAVSSPKQPAERRRTRDESTTPATPISANGLRTRVGAELGPWANLRTITPLRAEQTRVNPETVKFRPEIEPVVRLIEDTPRERALEVVIAQLKKGLSYKNLLVRLVPGGHPQHQAAAGRLQVPRGDGDQLGACSGPVGGRDRAAAALALGPR